MDRILDLEDGWRDSVLVSQNGHPATFTRHRAVNATMKFMAGSLTVAEAHIWADFILSTPAVLLNEEDEYELREFLEDWSSNGPIPIDRETVEVWQSRFAHEY